MSDPKVYIVQNTHHQDAEGRLVPKFTFEHLVEFLPGCDTVEDAKRDERVVECLPPGVGPWTHDVMARLRKALAGFTESDYLLCVGNPIIIGLVTAIAADRAASVQFLQWNRSKPGYVPVRVRVF